MPDKYTYPYTEVLKNKFNVNDSILLHAYERNFVPIRLLELYENPIRGSFDLKHLQKINRHLFQDIYTWAGKLREVDIAKVDQEKQLHLFCLSHRLDEFAESVFALIKNAGYLKGMDRETFAHKAAEVLGELNALHPFREGNGRTQREFMRELAANAGWDLSFNDIPQTTMIMASVAAMRMDYGQLEELIKESLMELPK